MAESVLTVADRILEALVDIGVVRWFGRPFPVSHPKIGVIEFDDPDLALLLADADGRVNDRWGVAFIDGDILHVSSRPGGAAVARSVTSLAGALSAIRSVIADDVPRTLALHLDLDLDEPVGDGVIDTEATEEIVVTLSPSLADLSIVALVGPGVTRGGHSAALASVAAQAGIGVFNTWGAKGVFRWDSPFHFGTIGLQARDLDFAGLDDIDMILTSGLDRDELDPEILANHLVQAVSPWQLGALLADWPRAHRSVGDRPPLYDEIASIVTPLYEAADAPITPARAALHLSGAAPERGVVVGDPGVAGFWLARTFPTGMPGSIVVPACRQPGFAAAAALVCGFDHRPCVAVTDGPLDEATEIVLEAGAVFDVPISLQVWGEGSTSPDDHVAMTTRGFQGSGVSVDQVGIDTRCIEPLIERLGEISAWPE